MIAGHIEMVGTLCCESHYVVRPSLPRPGIDKSLPRLPRPDIIEKSQQTRDFRSGVEKNGTGSKIVFDKKVDYLIKEETALSRLRAA